MEKLYDSELRLMEIVWESEPVSAKALSAAAAGRFGWNKNTTYTVVKRLIEKGVLIREDPGFICTSAVKKDAVQKAEIKSLVQKLFGGSKSALFSAFSDEKLSPEDIAALKALIDKEKE